MRQNPWNKLAPWYEDMVGKTGHKFHVKYAFPIVLKTLDLKEGESLLDMGCGQGAFAPYVLEAGCTYTGVDVSPEMIRLAQEKKLKNAEFFLGKAEEVHRLIPKKKYEHITFILSIQDIKNAQEAIKCAGSLLKENGDIVIFMLHPGFRIPRVTSFDRNENNEAVRRISRYASETAIPLDTNIGFRGKKITSYFYHRPLSTYFSYFKKNNLAVTELIEITEENENTKEIPTFMLIKLKTFSK